MRARARAYVYARTRYIQAALRLAPRSTLLSIPTSPRLMTISYVAIIMCTWSIRLPFWSRRTRSSACTLLGRLMFYYVYLAFEC
jgi:hypothetical protein